MGEVFKNIQIA